MIMQPLYVELSAAMECELIVKVLDLLVEIAERSAQEGDKTLAMEIIVPALEYPMREITQERAALLFLQLEMEVCPRVLADARDLADQLTLDELVARVLTHIDHTSI